MAPPTLLAALLLALAASACAHKVDADLFKTSKLLRGESSPAATEDTSTADAAYDETDVLHDPIEVYIIFYGDFDEATKITVRSLIGSISDASTAGKLASVHDWWNLALLYADSKNRHVTATVTLEGELGLKATIPTLDPDLIDTWIANLIDKGILPNVKGAIYAFLTSADVEVRGGYSDCSWHQAGTQLSVWATIPKAGTPCGPNLPVSLKYPGGSREAAIMVSELARQLVQTATDPFVTQWQGSGVTGAADVCKVRPFGNIYTNFEGVAYNHIARDGTPFILPNIQNPVTKQCAGLLSVLPGVCGDQAYGLPCGGSVTKVASVNTDALATQSFAAAIEPSGTTAGSTSAADGASLTSLEPLPVNGETPEASDEDGPASTAPQEVFTSAGEALRQKAQVKESAEPLETTPEAQESPEPEEKSPEAEEKGVEPKEESGPGEESGESKEEVPVLKEEGISEAGWPQDNPGGAAASGTSAQPGNNVLPAVDITFNNPYVGRAANLEWTKEFSG